MTWSLLEKSPLLVGHSSSAFVGLSHVKESTHCCNYKDTATHCNTLQHPAAPCNTLQHTATHCNTLQHPATHCNTLQHTATHCEEVYPSLAPYTQRGLVCKRAMKEASRMWGGLVYSSLPPLTQKGPFWIKRGFSHVREPKYRCHATQVLEKVCCMSSGLVYSSLQCVAVCFAVATMRRLKKRLLSYRVHVRESSHRYHPI